MIAVAALEMQLCFTSTLSAVVRIQKSFVRADLSGVNAIVIPAKAREYVFTGVGLSVCLSVCLSVTTITKKIVDGFAPNFMRRFLGGKGRPSSCFVTIGRGMWK